MATRHSAYSNPNYPTNALMAYMLDEKNRENWSEPDAIAAAMYHIVSRGERIPLRVPMGPDAWGMIKADVENISKELDELKELSIGVGRQDQLASIGFLQRSA